MHYYQFNIADYRKDTAHLSLLEHGVYRQLLDWYYISEEPIPKETQVVFRRLSARTQEEQNAILIVLDEFFSESENGWNHKKCDEEIEKFRNKAEIAKENGRLGGRPKKTQGVISGLSKKTQEKANSRTYKPNNSFNKEKDKKEKNNEELPTQNLVSQELWNSFLKIRQKAKAVNSPQAIKCLITELEKLRTQGHDPTEVVNQSIRSSWKDVYPVKNRGSPVAKFDPVAYVNKDRISKEDYDSDTRIVSTQ